MGKSFIKAIEATQGDNLLDVGCIAAHGHFYLDNSGSHKYETEGKPATAFLLRLIAQLQFSGTVPMIDVLAYADWLPE